MFLHIAYWHEGLLLVTFYLKEEYCMPERRQMIAKVYFILTWFNRSSKTRTVSWRGQLIIIELNSQDPSE
jgi:hypothetical protein